MALIVEVQSVSPLHVRSQRMLRWTGQARAITNMITNEYLNSSATSFCTQVCWSWARKQASWVQWGLHEDICWLRWWSRTSTLIATNLTSKQVRTQRELRWTIACLIATSVAMYNRIFKRESEGCPTQGDLLGRITEIDQKDVRESKLIHGNKDCRRKQKGINNQLDCDCYCVSLLWSEVHGYLHSRPTRRVHRVLTN